MLLDEEICTQEDLVKLNYFRRFLLLSPSRYPIRTHECL